jgi:hypothetical protein
LFTQQLRKKNVAALLATLLTSWQNSSKKYIFLSWVMIDYILADAAIKHCWGGLSCRQSSAKRFYVENTLKTYFCK